MRYGFTTGSCAAAAAKAAAYMLLTGKIKTQIKIQTPKGIAYAPKIEGIERQEEEVSCGVRKDGGDDPDITSGCLIFARVRLLAEKGIHIHGGEGVGRVTRPGLDQPVGSAAINHVPREMIRAEVQEVCRLCDYHGGLAIVISVPEGAAVAEKTFNPRLGIVGGISILGTTGIVEPMSKKAFLQSIGVEIHQKRVEGNKKLAVSPGNYGLDFMKRTYGYDLDRSVKCSNFIGETIDLAVEEGFEALLLTGHMGKLVKLSGGIMNTHSKEADCRMELMAAAAVKAEAPLPLIRRLLDCVTTEEAAGLLKEQGCCEAVMQILMEKIHFYLKKRADGNLRIECMMYAKEYGELAQTKGAHGLLKEIMEEI